MEVEVLESQVAAVVERHLVACLDEYLEASGKSVEGVLPSTEHVLVGTGDVSAVVEDGPCLE